MIQRVQTLHLGICALLIGIFLLSTLFVTSTAQRYTALDSIPGLSFAVLDLVMVFFAIFLFRNRPLQVKVTGVALLANVLAISLYGYKYYSLRSGTTEVSIRPGAVILLATLVFTYMALAAIRKDEKLVRESDRLR